MRQSLLLALSCREKLCRKNNKAIYQHWKPEVTYAAKNKNDISAQGVRGHTFGSLVL